MAGDRLSDKQAACENNIPFIGCAYGHAGTKEILPAAQVAYTPGDIEQCIQNILAQQAAIMEQKQSCHKA